MKERNKIEGIFSTIEGLITLLFIIGIIGIGFFGGGKIEFFDLSVENTKLHFCLLAIAFLAPRLGGLLVGGIESTLWGLHLSYYFFGKQVIWFIVTCFFSGTIGTMIVLILLQRLIIKILSSKFNA